MSLVEARRYFVASPGTKVCTQVDPQGLETVVDFGKEGRYDTSDPGILTVLAALAANGTIEEVEAPRPKKEADE